MVDPDTMSVVELYQVHVLSAENSQGASVSYFLKSLFSKYLTIISFSLFDTVSWNVKEKGNQKNSNSSFIFLHERFWSSYR